MTSKPQVTTMAAPEIPFSDDRASRTEQDRGAPRWFEKWRKTSDDVIPGQVTVSPQKARHLPRFVRPYAEIVMQRVTRFYYGSTLFVAVFAFLLSYFACVIIYALLIFAVNSAYAPGGECISGWDYDLSGRQGFKTNMEVVFALSWQTFSTVGYGTISPPADSGCSGLRWLLASEAFIGVLFSGFCGSIFYAKISRYNSRAPVTFSSAVCLQFGEGITAPVLNVGANEEKGDALAKETNKEESEVHAKEKNKVESDTLPFPFLEFRLVNSQAMKKKHEILAAKVTCVAIGFEMIDLELTKERMQDAANGTDFAPAYTGEPIARSYIVNLDVVPHALPFFNNVWPVRHTLDESSPILKPSIRDRIAELGGWPADINDFASIRNCFSPSLYEVIVSVEGTFNLTAESVFSKYAYRPADIFIGWQFASTLRPSDLVKNKGPFRRTPQGQIRLGDLARLADRSRVHDIVPQKGGGNEPAGDRVFEQDIVSFLASQSGEE